MPRKIVGITCNSASASPANGPRQTLNRAYVWAIEQAGGIPVILPVTAEPAIAARYLDAIDGLLLSGGVDLAPERYGQTPHPRLGEVDTERDVTELALIPAALAADIPIFAICRGIQALNVVMGGSLYQDLPSEFPSDIVHSQEAPRHERTHAVRIAPGTRLQAIVDSTEMRTNSFHHQALRDLAEGLVETAHTADGVVEAVESPGHRYVVGVQFHPEETAPTDEKSRRLFEAFLAAL